MRRSRGRNEIGMKTWTVRSNREEACDRGKVDKPPGEERMERGGGEVEGGWRANEG